MVTRYIFFVILLLIWNADISVVLASSHSFEDIQQAGKYSKRFKVFDGTLYKAKPDLSLFGIKPITILYVSKIWPDWHTGADKEKLPSKEIVKKLAKTAEKNTGIAVVDIEHWNMRGSSKETQESVSKYVEITHWIKDAAPELKIGYFAQPPIKDYARSILLGKNHYKYKKWKMKNDRLVSLANAVDIYFPSLYADSPQQKEWVTVAIEHIHEARRLSDKPVYVFLWPLYAERNQELGYTYISDQFWRLQLDTVYRYADGLVVWGGWDPVNGGHAAWDDNARWWSVLKEFLAEIAGDKVN